MSVEAARQAWRDWLKSERRLADHTLVAYEHDVATFLGFMTTYLGGPPGLATLGRLKPAEFRAWLADRSHQGLARTSTARAFSSVRSVFQFLDKRGLAHNASIGAIQTPKLPRSVPKALSERDMEDLLDAPAEQEREAWLDLRDAAVLMRLSVSSGSPDGVMCFGSRDPQAFGPEQATELLFFLAKVLENTIRAWLDLPE